VKREIWPSCQLMGVGDSPIWRWEERWQLKTLLKHLIQNMKQSVGELLVIPLRRPSLASNTALFRQVPGQGLLTKQTPSPIHLETWFPNLPKVRTLPFENTKCSQKLKKGWIVLYVWLKSSFLLVLKSSFKLVQWFNSFPQSQSAQASITNYHRLEIL
jgi:hypothetical protein